MLKNRHIHTLQWLLGGWLMMLLAACSSGSYPTDDEEAEQSVNNHKAVTLTVYVYSPEYTPSTLRRISPRRATTGEVSAIGRESTVYSLQLWIFESESGAHVGYLNTTDLAGLNTGDGTYYKIPVSDDFAERKPNVDVFVMANVTPATCGIGELDSETTREELLANAKIIDHSEDKTYYFGLSNLTKSVPEGAGLPMAGKLTVQPVVGDAPTLRVGTMDEVANVQLTRAVSKLRFVFAKTTGEPTVNITSITMHSDMIPEEEYLFRTPLSITYNDSEEELLSSPISDVAETANPFEYIYLNQDAQEYENLISQANLTVEGPIYLRETDKQLSGTISYKIDNGDLQTADFAMQAAGDFRRNHTWIVYAYYAGNGRLQLSTLYVKDWSEKETNHAVYNW